MSLRNLSSATQRGSSRHLDELVEDGRRTTFLKELNEQCLPQISKAEAQLIRRGVSSAHHVTYTIGERDAIDRMRRKFTTPSNKHGHQ